MPTHGSKVHQWLLSVLPGRTKDRCRELRRCLRIDSPSCCDDRIWAERSIDRIHDERRLWSV